MISIMRPLSECLRLWIFGLILTKITGLLDDCNQIITKSIPQATERIEALKNMGFVKSQNKMIGTHDRKEYDNYWIATIEKHKNTKNE